MIFMIMRFEQIDLNLFVVFDVIYREGSLTRAAEILSITQPAVSNALHRLRDSLDDPLFVRDGRRMRPTPVADNLIGPVRQALTQLQSSIKDRARFDPARSDRFFTLSVGDIGAAVLVPALLNRLRAEAPRVQLRCFQVERDEIARELASGRLDAAVDIAQVPGRGLKRQTLMADDFVCVLRAEHPLARGRLTLNRYLGLDHIIVSSRRHGAGYVDGALRQQGHRLRATLRLQTYQAAFHTVMASDMALAAPAALAGRYAVKAKPLPVELPALESQLLWHRTAEDDPANRWFRRCLRDAAKPARNRSKQGAKPKSKGLTL